MLLRRGFRGFGLASFTVPVPSADVFTSAQTTALANLQGRMDALFALVSSVAASPELENVLPQMKATLAKLAANVDRFLDAAPGEDAASIRAEMADADAEISGAVLSNAATAAMHERYNAAIRMVAVLDQAQKDASTYLATLTNVANTLDGLLVDQKALDAKAAADAAYWAAKHAADAKAAKAAAQSKLAAAKSALATAKATGDTGAAAQAKADIVATGGELSILDKYTVAGYPAVIVVPAAGLLLLIGGGILLSKKSNRAAPVAGYRRLRRSRR